MVLATLLGTSKMLPKRSDSLVLRRVRRKLESQLPLAEQFVQIIGQVEARNSGLDPESLAMAIDVDRPSPLRWCPTHTLGQTRLSLAN